VWLNHENKTTIKQRTLRAAAEAVVSVGRVVNLAVPIMDTMQLPDATSDDEWLAYSRGSHARSDATRSSSTARRLRWHTGADVEDGHRLDVYDDGRPDHEAASPPSA
jgi:hypothetical protein